MREERMDLSAVDPMRDSVSWERRIKDTVRLAVEARKGRMTLWFQLAMLAKPALVTAAAAACLCVFLAAESGNGGVKAQTTLQTEPSLALASWAAGESLPSTDRIFQILGGTYVEE